MRTRLGAHSPNQPGELALQLMGLCLTCRMWLLSMASTGSGSQGGLGHSMVQKLAAMCLPSSQR